MGKPADPESSSWPSGGMAVWPGVPFAPCEDFKAYLTSYMQRSCECSLINDQKMNKYIAAKVWEGLWSWERWWLGSRATRGALEAAPALGIWHLPGGQGSVEAGPGHGPGLVGLMTGQGKAVGNWTPALLQCPWGRT